MIEVIDGVEAYFRPSFGEDPWQRLITQRQEQKQKEAETQRLKEEALKNQDEIQISDDDE